MSKAIYDTIVCSLETVALLLFAGSFLKRHSCTQKVIYCLIGCFLTPLLLNAVCNRLDIVPPQNVFPHIVLDAFFITLLYEDRTIKKIGVVILYYFTLGLTESFTINFLMTISDFGLENVRSYDTKQLVGTAISHSLLLIFIFIIHKIRFRTNTLIPIWQWSCLLLIPLTCIPIMMYGLPYEIEGTFVTINSMLSLLLFIYILWLCFYWLAEEYQVNCLSLKINGKAMENWSKEQTLYNKNTGKILHDIRKLLPFLHTILESSPDYMKKIDLVAQMSNYTGNRTIDIFLEGKIAEAHRLGIKLCVKGSLPNKLSVNLMDLITLLMNGLDNAIEAAALTAKNKTVFLNLEFVRSRLRIEIKNPTIRTQIPFPPYRSIKHNTDRHGFGIISMQEIVDKYQGIMRFSLMESEMTLQILLQKQKNGKE